MAAADLFVEKAQVHLTQRADLYSLAGAMFAIMSLAIIAFMIFLAAFYADIGTYFTQDSWKLVILIILKAAALAGFAGAAIYFCASLSRAFFHEATTLYNRRHALRFGRMFVYLKFGVSKTDRENVVKFFAISRASILRRTLIPVPRPPPRQRLSRFTHLLRPHSLRVYSPISTATSGPTSLRRHLVGT